MQQKVNNLKNEVCKVRGYKVNGLDIFVRYIVYRYIVRYIVYR